MTTKKITLSTARVLLKLSNGEKLNASSAKYAIINTLIDEGIVVSQGRHKRTLQAPRRQLLLYLDNQYQIKDLEEYIKILESEDINRAAATKASTDSKLKSTRTFKGFLVNSFSPITAQLNNQKIEIFPQVGSFIFISDYETFKIPENITIVGMENAENFTNIRKQRHLFKDITPLFISRYPQTQNKDVIKWLKSIPNPYLHFGDFDIAGIGIYINEYEKHLHERAHFFIPDDIDNHIKKYGSRKRFDTQRTNFSLKDIQEPSLLSLYETIQQERKGLDQEYFIS